MKKRNLRAPLAALPLAILATISHAQTPTLPATVVTATRVAQPLTDVVADVSIVDRATIERSGASGVADVLGRLPGVSFVRNGGPASTTSLYLRGADTRFTAVFVDGVRVDSQSTGGASWQGIPLSQIDRIEVLRGPAAAVYGSDALGGVIQIFTRRGEAGFAPSVELGLGSHGTRKVAASFSGKQGAVDYSFGAAREISDGFNVTPAGNPDFDGYRNKAVSGSLGWQLSQAHRLQVTLLDSDSNAQYDGFAPGQDDRAQQYLQTLGLKWSAQWSEVYSSQLSLGRSKDTYETSPSEYLTDTRVTSYLWQNDWKFGVSHVTVALERREDRLDNASTSPVISDRSQNALALGYGLRTGDHSLQLNLRRDDDSEFGGQSTGSAAYAYGFAPHWRALVSAGTAFRAPTLFQRFSIYGEPGLQPETSRNVEAGLKYEAQGHNFSLMVYRNRVSNLINYVAGPGPCINSSGCYANTGEAEFRGVTLAGASRLGPVGVTGSLDWKNPKDQTSGLQLARRAKQSAKLGLDLPVAGWLLGAEAELVGRRFNDVRNKQVLAGYGLLNLSVSKPFARDWTVVGRVDNLGDRDYETARGYATGGRTVYLGVKWAPR